MKVISQGIILFLGCFLQGKQLAEQLLMFPFGSFAEHLLDRLSPDKQPRPVLKEGWGISVGFVPK